MKIDNISYSAMTLSRSTLSLERQLMYIVHPSAVLRRWQLNTKNQEAAHPLVDSFDGLRV